MTRAAFADHIRKYKPIPASAVPAFDAFADAMGFPRAEETGPRPSAAAVEMIKRFEGCRLDAYPDPGSGGDPWTIGFGATGPGIRRGVRWTQAEADKRIAEDVARFGEGVRGLVGTAATTQAQFDALTSFAFNVGLGNLKSSTLLKRHKAGDYAGAAGEFARWNRAAGRVLVGLTTRRAAEAKLYRGEP